MTVAYQLRVYDRAGVIQSVITDFLHLAYTKEVNAAGMCEFSLPPEHRAIGMLQIDSTVEVWRANPERGIAWQQDFLGLFRYEERTADSDGQRRYLARCPGILHLLARPIIAYRSETNTRSTFTNIKAETIAKTLVRYNATADGTTGDGRIRQAETLGVTLEPDAARGNALDFACAWQNLLSSLQKNASVGGGDFDLVNTAAPTQYEFRWYAGQRGANRSAAVVFSLKHGNMANPTLTRDWLDERTIVMVGGRGADADRTVISRTGPMYTAGYRATELFVSAPQYTTVAGLQAVGDTLLHERRTRDMLTFDVLQAPQSLYGRDYFLGDLVTGVFEDVTAIKKIQQISIALAPTGEETIQIRLADD